MVAMTRSRVCVAVPTYNRPGMLIELLRALGQQTVPIDDLVVVDNGSTDSSACFLEAKEFPGVTRPRVFSLEENAGSAGGFYVAVREALNTGCDFIWLFDDDTEPAPDCLARLLAVAESDKALAAVTPRKNESDGRIMLMPRGRFVNGWHRPLPASEYEHETVAIDYSSPAGLLVRSSAVEMAGLPMAELYMWYDDVEWTLRLSKVGPLLVVPGAILRHKEDIYEPYVPGIRGTLRLLRRPIPNDQLWKFLCGCRNMTWVRRHRGRQGVRGFLLYLLVICARMLLFNPQKLRRTSLFIFMSVQGYRGRFDNLTAAQWAEVLAGPRPIRAFRQHARRGAILPERYR
jgi:rhamnopyranosyl-N-acetylglucosaminyl-diphospho-decaprenol beta-1,3/1,4-galactofuranosyltransferase